MKPRIYSLLQIGLLTLVLSTCGVAFASSDNTETGESQDEETDRASIGYSVGGIVTGLILGESVTLQNNGSNDLTIEANGSFIFTNKLPDGGPYDVTVLTQPALPDLTCSVTNGKGTVVGENITDVQVGCVFPPHPTCSGGIGDGDVVVMSHDYNSGTAINCEAENSIALEKVSVTNGTTLDLKSYSIFFRGRVKVELGSQLRVSLLYIPIRSNDTGIVNCADDVFNGWFCPIATHPGQDGDYGRDVTDNDDIDGQAGFSFTKLDTDGKQLPTSATSWSCVKDNVTGLIWEGKIDDGGLHDKDDQYSWYNTNPDANGGHTGYAEYYIRDVCYGYDSSDPATYCNTLAYVVRINQEGLCGYKDWRLPTIEELHSLVDYSIPYPGPTIDTGYFPNAVGSYVWSSSPFAYSSDNAWIFDFRHGYDYTYHKSNARYVRLVRGEQ